MNYWLDLFTGTTWQEFRDAGASVSGFTIRQKPYLERVKPGDIFLCYLTGVMRWIGALEVIGPSNDTRPIWNEMDFPVRFEIKPLVMLDPEHGVPMIKLEGRVEFYRGPEHRGKYKGRLRGSLGKPISPEDGQFILNLLRQFERNPVPQPVDPRKLARKPFYKAKRKVGRKGVEALVSVPETQEEATDATIHTKIQYQLLKLGADMRLEVWLARNDRAKRYLDQTLGAMPRVVDELPVQFNDATQRTIELIDVLWLKGNTIVAAFEVESTTSIYSGLLRMSDLLALQPNLNIRLYLVAPDERHDKVEQEIRRPTFQFRTKPLAEVCGFIAFSTLQEKIQGINKLGLAGSLTPDFLLNTAEFF